MQVESFRPSLYNRSSFHPGTVLPHAVYGLDALLLFGSGNYVDWVVQKFNDSVCSAYSYNRWREKWRSQGWDCIHV